MFPSLYDAPGAAAAAGGEKKKAARAPGRGLSICFATALSTRNVVATAAAEIGASVVLKPEKSDVVWGDVGANAPGGYARPPTVAAGLLPHQRSNIVPGFTDLCHKCSFGRVMGRMAQLFPDEYDFVPRTFALPWERAELDAFAAAQGGKGATTWIVKPNVGSHGDGMFLTTDHTDTSRLRAAHEQCVFQQYLPRPLLLGRFKFDCRVYVLLTAVEGRMRWHVLREGLARLASAPYEPLTKANFGNVHMHLTNYTLNKHSHDFVHNTDADDDDECSKRRLTTAFAQLAAQHGHFDPEAAWYAIDDVVQKTLFALQPHLLAHAGVEGTTHTGSATAIGCNGLPLGALGRTFQLIGFDVFFDATGKPHLLEINSRPSLQCDAPIDDAVKGQVATAIVRILAATKPSKATKKGGASAAAAATAVASRAGDEEATGALEAAAVAGRGDVASFYSGAYDTHDADHARLAGPLLQAKDLFLAACGGTGARNAGQLNSMRLLKLLRAAGVAGRRQSTAPSSATSVSEGSAGAAAAAATPGTAHVPASVAEVAPHPPPPPAQPRPMYDTCSVDLLFQRAKARRGAAYLGFEDFLDLLLKGPLGHGLSPATEAGSLERLQEACQRLGVPPCDDAAA